MAGTYFSFDNFKALIYHHIGVYNRFDPGHKRKFSILFFPLKDMDIPTVTQALSKALRESDAVCAHADGYYLVLPETDTEGALHILNLLKEYFGQEMDEVIMTFPDDGTKPEAILDQLKTYAKEWCKSDLDFPNPRP